VVEPKASPLLPQIGDVVYVTTGSDRLRGRVLESYATGAQPRVTLELDGSYGSGERSTITISPDSLEPAESTDSPWADGWRYEKNFADAIRRLFGRVTIEPRVPFAPAQPDFTLLLGMRRIAVETKFLRRPMGRSYWLSVVRFLREAASKNDASALLVTNADAKVLSEVARDVRVVRWSGSGDAALKDALAQIWDAPADASS
jgi:hypothetical protein